MVSAGLSLGLAAAGCGCTDRSVSALVIEPPTPCLELSLPSSVSNCAIGDHNPNLTLSGTNTCDVTFTIHGDYRNGSDLVVPPGGPVSYKVDWTFGGDNVYAYPFRGWPKQRKLLAPTDSTRRRRRRSGLRP
jgi:hypothetical protein